MSAIIAFIRKFVNSIPKQIVKSLENVVFSRLSVVRVKGLEPSPKYID